MSELFDADVDVPDDADAGYVRSRKIPELFVEIVQEKSSAPIHFFGYNFNLISSIEASLWPNFKLLEALRPSLELF